MLFSKLVSFVSLSLTCFGCWLTFISPILPIFLSLCRYSLFGRSLVYLFRIRDAVLRNNGTFFTLCIRFLCNNVDVNVNLNALFMDDC
mmetsp:Transcript_19659/g.54702  ORF Transcript_19659/g.54702 Transcript_19659/m.54702 type:complete len:88 (+) Transcript_19659:41-304(+)